MAQARSWNNIKFVTLTCLASSLLAHWASAENADVQASNELPNITIVGAMPLPGYGVPVNQIPGNVQSASGQEMQRQHSLDISDYLNNNFSGISINQTQDNPLQNDVNYHGFTASPLLGTPQGLSVYVDGVRVNEAFGDTVNWDLIPENAISSITLMPGSNPVYGLNTLGGALSVQTKSGHSDPGTELEAYAGSFARTAFQGSTGGSTGALDWFLAANLLDEHGWRDLSPTHARQLFGKVGWQTDTLDVDFSYTWADNSMTGNGATPQSMLDYHYALIYSAPDYTHNHLNFVNLTASRKFGGRWLLSGNIYYRDLATNGNNGDVNDDNYLSDEYDGPDIDCAAPYDSLIANAYCSNGINRASRLVQQTAGVGMQLTNVDDLFGRTNQFVVGGEYSRATDTYNQYYQYAILTPERTAIGNDNPFNPNEIVNSIGSNNDIWGLYLADTWSPNDLLHFAIAARYNHSHETINGFSVGTDLGDYGDGFNEANPVTGDHVYNRLNPSLGFTVTPDNGLTLYANYAESSRAPTVIELGCSDPDMPCGLPNDFASDPDLSQVVSKTFDMGLRGKLNNQLLTWSIDLFRTVNTNDIQFIATAASQGYFTNVGDTRRQGLDLGLGGKAGALNWHATYSMIDATYRSTFEVNGESNSSADAEGNILVEPGARIPLIPRHIGRLKLDYDLNTNWNVGANAVVSSGSFLHGNENNSNKAGAVNAQGAEVIGSGQLGTYTVVNLFMTVHAAKWLDVFARADNLFNHKYSTAGFLTANAFDANGSFRDSTDDWTNENSVSPGAPFAVWAGVRIHWE